MNIETYFLPGVGKRLFPLTVIGRSKFMGPEPAQNAQGMPVSFQMLTCQVLNHDFFCILARKKANV